MVHGFLIHTLSSNADESQSFCRVLYSRTFSAETFDNQTEEEREQDLETERLRRKEQLLTVARQVESSCVMLRQTSCTPLDDSAPPVTPEELLSLQDADFGVFGLAPGDPFSERKTVLWMGVLMFGFALICDAEDNLVLAESTLRMLVKFLVDALKLQSQSNDVVLKADKAEILLNTFVPHGQLLFLNHQCVQALEKELSPSVPK